MSMEQIEVKILDRTVKLQVPSSEKPRLMNAVQIVDQKMRSIRDAGMAHGTERIAVHAALQITYEFLGQPLLHVGLGHGGLTQAAAQKLVLVRKLTGNFKQALHALGQKLEIGFHARGW